jgi:hypothetical protein
MDDSALRAFFDRVARTELPPSTVDVPRARQAGRRRLTIRRVGVPGMLLGVVSVIVFLLASNVLPGGAAGYRTPSTGSRHTSSPAAPGAPRSFDPLAIWAGFGWLPPGFSLATPPYPETRSRASMVASGSPGDLSVTVFAADQCKLTGPFSAQSQPGSSPATRYPAGLRCKWGGTPWIAHPVTPAGHLANGDTAYRMMALGGGPSPLRQVGLAWEYAGGGWAILTSAGVTWPDAKKVAASVRYGSRVRPPFPVRLAGIPARLKVSGAEYQDERGKLVGHALYLGTGHDPGVVQITVEPAFHPACLFTAGEISNISFEGAEGVLVKTPSEHQQDVCFPSLHGMFVWVSVHGHVGRAMSLLRHIRVLGPDRADWTTHPLG